MPSAAYHFYVDWNGNGSFADSGEDITSLVMEAEWSMGRDYASQLTGRSTAARCLLVLKNFDNRFSSFNAASPLYGNLLPGRAVRITMTVGVTTTTMFQGFLDSIEAQPDESGGYKAILRGIGALGWITQRKVSVAMQANIATGAAIEDVLDEIGWPAGLRDLDTGQTTMTRWWTGGKVDALNAIKAIEETDNGFVRETKDGKVAFEDRHHRLKGAHLTSQATYSDAVGAALGYSQPLQGDPLREIYNIVGASVRIFQVGAVTQLWLLEDPTGGDRKIPPGTSRTWWATFPNPTAPTNAVAVETWTTPVATTDFTANSASDGSGTDLTASISIVVVKFDQSMKITLTNGASVDAFVTLLKARGTPVLEATPITIEREDTASQTKYGERTYPVPAKFLPSSTTADDYVLFTLSTYKDPIQTLSLGFLAEKSTAYLTEARDRDVSDRITIVANGAAGLGINGDFFVERISHRVRPGGHRVEIECSPAAPWADWWILGVGALGSTTKLAY